MGVVSEDQFISWLGPAYVKLLDDGRIHASLAAQRMWNIYGYGNGFLPLVDGGAGPSDQEAQDQSSRSILLQAAFLLNTRLPPAPKAS